MTMQTEPKETGMAVALTIAGSDSSGGAGIQADLKTFSALGVFGASAVTCLTAQNPKEVAGIVAIEPDMVAAQIKAVCDEMPVAAAKTGMLYTAQIIRTVAKADVRQGIPVLVVDPVMVASSGAILLKHDAIDALCAELLPQARVITPNIHEAEILCGHPIRTLDEMKATAEEIGDRYDVACVIKGRHLAGDDVFDVLYDEGEAFVYTGRRVEIAESHGAGCCFSAAVTAYLAKGDLLHDAVGKAKEFVRRAMEASWPVGRHHPLNFFWNSAGGPG